MTREQFPDIVIEAGEGGAVLVEVKGQPRRRDTLSQIRRQLQAYLEEHAGTPPAFTVIVDPQTIQFFRNTNLEQAVQELSTVEILKHYDAGLGEKRVFEPYLVALTEAWLNDLAVHWKSGRAPGEDDVPAGFLEVLRAA
jgi:hypothetical protein